MNVKDIENMFASLICIFPPRTLAFPDYNFQSSLFPAKYARYLQILVSGIWYHLSFSAEDNKNKRTLQLNAGSIKDLPCLCFSVHNTLWHWPKLLE